MNLTVSPWKMLSATLSLGTECDGWNLAESPSDGADEKRTFTYTVFFVDPFFSTPVVNLGLTGFDMDQRDGGRIHVKSTCISNEGFQVEVTTWRETRVYSVEISWLAIGE